MKEDPQIKSIAFAYEINNQLPAPYYGNVNPSYNSCWSCWNKGDIENNSFFAKDLYKKDYFNLSISNPLALQRDGSCQLTDCGPEYVPITLSNGLSACMPWDCKEVDFTQRGKLCSMCWGSKDIENYDSWSQKHRFTPDQLLLANPENPFICKDNRCPNRCVLNCRDGYFLTQDNTGKPYCCSRTCKTWDFSLMASICNVFS